MAQKAKLDPKVVTALLVAQAVIGTITVRDIASRDASQVRGPRVLWKVWGGSNALGALLYWLVGRRRNATGITG